MTFGRYLFFFTGLVLVFCRCIFFCRIAYFVAGFLGVERWVLDMAVVSPGRNSTDIR